MAISSLCVRMKILLSVMFVVNLVCISYLHLFMGRIEWRTIE